MYGIIWYGLLRCGGMVWRGVVWSGLGLPKVWTVQFQSLLWSIRVSTISCISDSIGRAKDIFCHMGCQGSLSEEESQTTAVGSESPAQDDKEMEPFCPVKFQRNSQLRSEFQSTSIPKLALTCSLPLWSCVFWSLFSYVFLVAAAALWTLEGMSSTLSLTASTRQEMSDGSHHSAEPNILM